VLETLPITPNGKLDRKVLPAPSANNRARRASDIPADHATARSVTVEQLSRIWCELISIDHVEDDESFFDIGGHSLLATSLALRIRETFGVELEFARIFDVPTLGAMAATLDVLRAQHSRHGSAG
jgi:acyl carrier protein